MIFHKIAFHPNEKPRGWLRKILFHNNLTPRKAFHRVVFRKNGDVRNQFIPWMLNSGADPEGSGESDTSRNRGFEQPPSIALRTLLNLKPLEETVTHWKRDATPGVSLRATDLLPHLKANGHVVLSVGHDNYKEVSGGIQLCIQREEQAIRERGDQYLNLRPLQPLPRLAHLDEAADPWVELTLDGAPVGAIQMSELTQAVNTWTASGSSASVVVHHLLGHNPEHISALVQATRGGICLFWLHDFFSLCTSYTLRRNDIGFCHAPPLTSNACSLCVYGEERASHLKRMEGFFESCDVHVISPSEVTLDFWLQHAAFRSTGRHVAPHMSLEWSDRVEPAAQATDNPHRLNVAFLGTMAPHKGWPLFERLASDTELAQKFQFLAFTAASSVPKAIKHVFIKSSADQPNAMADAIQANGVDLVLHWPTWPETFSLTTYEALAGGAFVVTNTVSGNVAATVRRLGRGAVLESESDLIAFFTDGRASQMCEEARGDRSHRQVKAQLSDMSAPFLTDAR